MVMAPSSPASARIEPTDRSIPPAMMITVMPSAMMLITAVCRTTLERFVAVRKLGEAMERMMNSAISVKNGSSRWIIRLAPRWRRCSLQMPHSA